MPLALITGGSSGIGAAFARALARDGHDLVLVARDAERLGAAAAEHRAAGRRVEVLVADLADRDDVERVAERLRSEHDPVDVLVSNAGFGVHGRLTDADPSRQELALDVMVRAVLVLGGAAGRAMRERGGGTIINVSSVAGFVTMGGYSAIKAWVTAYSQALANELHGTGVRVTALCPGWVRTEFHERARIRASSIPPFLWLDADDVVRECLDDVARGRVVSVPSRRFRAIVRLARHLPMGAVRTISRGLTSRRHGE